MTLDRKRKSYPENESMSYYKIINPDPKDVTVCVLNTYITLPSNGFAVVSEAVKQQIEISYAQLEIVQATLEQYQEYRLACDKAEQIKVKVIEDAKKRAIEEEKESKKVAEAPKVKVTTKGRKK